MINILMSRGILGHPELSEQLKEYIKKDHKVAILLYSFFDKDLPTQEAYDSYYQKGSEYYVKMIMSFEPYGIQEENITFIDYYRDSTETSIKKIQASDILYFPGGAPDSMMMRIKEKNIQEAIEKHQKIYIGSSAGAMIQFKNYHISKDSDYQCFRYEQGLNLLDGFSIEVHYRRRKNQKRAIRKVHRSYKHPIITIPDDGVCLVTKQEIFVIGSAKLYYDQKGIMKTSM